MYGPVSYYLPKEYFGGYMKNRIITIIKTAVSSKYIFVGLLFFCVLIAGMVVSVLVGDEAVSTSVSSKELPIYSVDTNEKKVALSFDAAWGNEDTAQILAILEKHDVKVTFFMTGGWVEKYPEDVKAIGAAGHDLGNHSENHKQMSKLSYVDCQEEILKVHEKVESLTGKSMCLFRPPYGDYNDNLIKAAEEVGYYTIQWDVDSLDWMDYGAENIIKTVLHHKNLRNGSIILMHNGAKYTKDALEAVITGLKALGYEIVPISQLIYSEDYEIDHTGRQFKK